MIKFSKKDLLFSIITGLTAGIISWRIFSFLGVPTLGLPGHPHALLIIIIPILWILGVNLGYFLGKWISFFNQLGKFAAVGFTNAAVDFGILNLAIGLTGVSSGWQYSMFKSLSFMVAVTHSYIWNKYWVFNAGKSGQGNSEFTKFMTVNIIAIIVNVGIASFVVNYIDPLNGVNENVWANIGAVIGSAFSLFLTFAGARLIVFKKNDSNPISQIQTPEVR